MTALLPSGVVSVSCVQLNGAYAHSIPTLKTFLLESVVEEACDASDASDAFLSDAPHPDKLMATITPVSANAAIFLLFILISSLMS